MNIKKIIMDETIPDKPFFKSGEIFSLLKVKPHEISYWETQFPKVKGQKNKQGQKIYQREDVLMLAAIKHLLHEKKFTIAGTKKILADSDELFNTISYQNDSFLESAANLSLSEPLAATENSETLNKEEASFNKMTADIYDNNAYELENISNEKANDGVQFVAPISSPLPIEHIDKPGISASELQNMVERLNNSKNSLKNIIELLDNFRFVQLD